MQAEATVSEKTAARRQDSEEKEGREAFSGPLMGLSKCSENLGGCGRRVSSPKHAAVERLAEPTPRHSV